jgi:hypothetical protein
MEHITCQESNVIDSNASYTKKKHPYKSSTKRMEKQATPEQDIWGKIKRSITINKIWDTSTENLGNYMLTQVKKLMTNALTTINPIQALN